VHRIRGVLNGTTNFLLGRIEAGARFHDALAEAHERGFAEADPSRDLDGLDTADKVRVLAWLAFGVDPARIDVPTRGIRPDPERLVAEARAGGGVVRLVGECAAAAGGVSARVGPVVLPRDSPLANVAGEENIVIIDTGWNGSIRLAGPGAGGRPTASALLADMVAGGVGGAGGGGRAVRIDQDRGGAVEFGRCSSLSGED
jgi:homoserine dehydrogenase